VTTAPSTTPAAGSSAAGTPAAARADDPQVARTPLLPTAHVDTALIERLAKRVAVFGPAKSTLTSRAPYTGEVIGTVPESTPDDVAEAYRRARLAQQQWGALPISQRLKPFRSYGEQVLARQGQILDLIQLENGKARTHAFEEVADVGLTARYYVANAEAHLGREKHKGALPLLTKTIELHHPRGVVGIISPWNYPLVLAITDAIPALIAGNAVVLKPDLQTIFSALWAADLLIQAGLPADLLQIVAGDGPVLGPSIVEGADYVSFTGSTRVGRLIATQAAERLVGCSLELGGKNAMVVLDDADLDKAARGAVRACFSSAGQLCISIERLMVHESVHDEFIRRFADRVNAMTIGPALDFEPDMGSLTSQRQLDTVIRHVDDAVAKGATVVTGGRARPDLGPYFYEPTILTGVTPDMALCAAETFGPVVAVSSFRTEDEAVERANASDYGLNASVWTTDHARGRRLAARIQAGTVNVNEGYAAAWGSTDAPMGGFKDSGLGRRHGREGIVKYTESQTIATQRLLGFDAPFGMGNEAYAKFLTTAVKLMKRIPGR
jgi:succinate-semialdehyde dehydrogenase/glutarate-semialdehyde dehydrogenase